MQVRNERLAARPVVVLEASSALLLLGDRGIEVEVEFAVARRRPRKRPSHPALERLQLGERRERYGHERDVMVRQVDGEAVEAVGDRRARRTARRVIRPEHEVIDEELRAPPKEICERGLPFVRFEAVLLFHADPRQVLAPLCEFIALARQRLFRIEQVEPGGKPLLACSDLVCRHRHSPLSVTLEQTRTGD